MNRNEKIRESILTSLKKAKETIQRKSNIENEILSIVKIIEEFSDELLTVNVINNDGRNLKFRDPDKLVIVQQREQPLNAMILLGYTIHEENTFPVMIESATDYCDCNNNEEINDAILEIIDENSLKMIQIANTPITNIPF
ncbi:hypothetical protein ACVQK1_17005 [Edwardsiella tarda]